MPQNIVGAIPEFTKDDTSASEQVVARKEVKQPEAEHEFSTEEHEAATGQEKDTPSSPEEKPALQEKESEDTETSPVSPEESETEKALQKLQEERAKLLREVKELRGSKRELKEKQIEETQKQIDDLKDMHPDDVTTIERVLRSKGYVTKEEASRMFYEAVKQEELDKFIAKYPEYSPDNDPENVNWTLFERQIEREKEMGYQLPKNPHLIGKFLERVHRELNKETNRGTSSTATKQRQIQTASVGGGGTQQPSSPNRLDPELASRLKGFSQEEMQRIADRYAGRQ